MRRTRCGVEVWVGLVAIDFPREYFRPPWAEGVCWDASAKSDKLVLMGCRLCEGIDILFGEEGACMKGGWYTGGEKEFERPYRDG